MVLGFLTSILFACEAPLVEKVESKHPNNEPYVVGYYKKEGDKEIKVEEKHFHDNGQLKMEGKLIDGKRDGEWKAYFNNGQVQSEGMFTNGNREGKAKVYFSDGQVRYEGEYKNNKKTGHWKFYNEQGKLIKEQDF